MCEQAITSQGVCLCSGPSPPSAIPPPDNNDSEEEVPTLAPAVAPTEKKPKHHDDEDDDWVRSYLDLNISAIQCVCMYTALTYTCRILHFVCVE